MRGTERRDQRGQRGPVDFGAVAQQHGEGLGGDVTAAGAGGPADPDGERVPVHPVGRVGAAEGDPACRGAGDGRRTGEVAQDGGGRSELPGNREERPHRTIPIMGGTLVSTEVPRIRHSAPFSGTGESLFRRCGIDFSGRGLILGCGLQSGRGGLSTQPSRGRRTVSVSFACCSPSRSWSPIPCRWVTARRIRVAGSRTGRPRSARSASWASSRSPGS